MTSGEPTATPKAESCYALRTGLPVTRWLDGIGPLGARCTHCGYVITCVDRTADWVHNGTRQIRCDPWSVVQASA